MTNKYNKMSNNLGMFCLWSIYILYNQILFIFKYTDSTCTMVVSLEKEQKRFQLVLCVCVGVFLDSTTWSQTECITQHGFEFMILLLWAPKY